MQEVVEDVDYFEYERSWETEYRAKRIVAEWHREYPDQFSSEPGARRPGTLQYFAQYSLMYVLRRDFGVQSLTWLHLAAIDDDTRRRFAASETCVRAVPKPCRDHARFEKRSRLWDTMRAQMGAAAFSALQRAIVEAGFGGYTGEPDLFCYRDGAWFFAEAKTEDEPLRKWQREWFRIARDLSDLECRIFLCRMVPKGCVRAAAGLVHSGPLLQMLGTGSDA